MKTTKTSYRDLRPGIIIIIALATFLLLLIAYSCAPAKTTAIAGTAQSDVQSRSTDSLFQVIDTKINYNISQISDLSARYNQEKSETTNQTKKTEERFYQDNQLTLYRQTTTETGATSDTKTESTKAQRTESSANFTLAQLDSCVSVKMLELEETMQTKFSERTVTKTGLSFLEITGIIALALLALGLAAGAVYFFWKG
jgi:cobalamin biosynthesis Mg chelatase CobN